MIEMVTIPFTDYPDWGGATIKNQNKQRGCSEAKRTDTEHRDDAVLTTIDTMDTIPGRVEGGAIVLLIVSKYPGFALFP